ncbi:MAG: HIT family hydrolase [Candidatus Aenigmarchaeota archaeon ex4484_56]|nr:MAG: HIT family hydrolase [Candidatus Aenigmarchaeota archaeon ex4484_56]
MDCIFCKIVSNEIPTTKIYEDENTLAFLDINPCSPGHTVIIPKKHYQKLEEMSEEEVKKLFGVIYKLIKPVLKGVNSTNCNIGINNGKCAGQEVPHVHFHIIPRFENDGGGPLQKLVRLEVKEDLSVIADRIKNNIPKQKNNKDKEYDPDREWQEFKLEIEDKVPDYSDARNL